MSSNKTMRNWVGIQIGSIRVLTLLQNGGRNDKTYSYPKWKILCRCGKVFEKESRRLSYSPPKSCGCEIGIRGAKTRTTNGSHRNPEYSCWLSLRARCNRKTDPNYSKYGGRGITVCSRWNDSFTDFLKDIGPRPSKQHTIDRIDNNKGYSPDNCRWATKKEQSRNMRNNVRLLFDGDKLTIREWSEKLGISSQTLWSRYRAGKSILEILTVPVHK